MGFLDKAKEKAKELTDQAKEKIDDVKDKRKADDLLDDLGRITYRQRTGRGAEADEAEIATLVAALQALEAEGTDVLGAPKEAPAETGTAETGTAEGTPGGGDAPPSPDEPLPPPPLPT